MNGAAAASAPPDGVLARRTPNTPPRSKGKGKAKARQPQERGPPSATPTAPYDVDREASGKDNIGLGLEQFQFEEAIRASRADGGGPEGGSSSVGSTSSTNDTGVSAIDEAYQPPTGSAAAAAAPTLGKRKQPEAPDSDSVSSRRNSSNTSSGGGGGGEEEEEEDPRHLRGAHDTQIYRGKIAGVCPPNVRAKILEAAARLPVGTRRLMSATSDTEGGLVGALARTRGLAGYGDFIIKHGGELTLDRTQINGAARAAESVVGQCNNGPKNFHEAGADSLTAKCYRAAMATVPLTTTGPLYGKNRNDGWCAITVNDTGKKNCQLNCTYPPEQRLAAEQIERALHEKIAESGVEVLMRHEFGDFDGRKHAPSGKPFVWTETVGRLLVITFRGGHISHLANSACALRTNIEGRMALRVRAKQALGQPVDMYTEDDVADRMLDCLEKLATLSEEPEERRAALRPEKTSELKGMVSALRGKPLEAVMEGVRAFGSRYGGRGLNAEDGRKGGAAKYTAEERGADKSTVELKAEGGRTGGAASAGVNPEGRGPNGPVGGGWKGDQDLMEPYRFRAGARVVVKGEEVELPSMTLRCESKVAGHAKPVAFLVETTGEIAAEERQCSCRKTLRVSETDKKTLESLGIAVYSSATSGRRRNKSMLQTP